MTRKQFRPFVMPGRPHATKRRPTIADPPDRRVSMPQHMRPVPAAVLRRLLFADGTLDPRLRATDRHFQRWAVTPGGGLKWPGFAVLRLDVSSRDPMPPALRDDESYLIDLAVREARPWAKSFVLMWYRSERMASEIAEALKVKRPQDLVHERCKVLSYFHGRLDQMGLQIASWDGEHPPEDEQAMRQST